MKKTILFSFAFISALAASIVLSDQNVSAISGPCQLGGGSCSAPGDYGKCGVNDVLPGRDVNCNGSALGGVNTKTEFINAIINRFNGANNHASRGARFIMIETTGTANPAQFKKLLEQPSVTIGTGVWTGSVTSWRDASKNDFFYDNYKGGYSRNSIIIKQNGTVLSAIEIACGNMTGKHSPPSPPPNTTIRPYAQLPRPGPYSNNEVVPVKAWVDKVSGPTTRSNWAFAVWYDQNGDSSQNDGPANVIAEDTGGPTTYNSPRTDIKDQTRTINGAKDRICVKLNLSGATDNVEDGNTNINGDPSIDCRAISNPPPPTNHPPAGWISITPCSPSSSQHTVSYGGINDPNGATQGQVSTSSSPTTNNVAGPTSSNGAVARTSSAAVTYYLHVRDILANGNAGSWTNVASATFNNAACPETVTISPDADLLNGSGNVISGAVTPGISVSAQTRVYNDGDVTTHSNWVRSFWYENNGNDTYNSGTDTPISGSSTPLSGGPTNYAPLVYTSVAGNPSTTIDGTRTRICVSLSLSSPAATPITHISSNPSITCRSIIANPNELTPDVDLSTSVLEPGQQVSATAEVECDPGTNPSSSNYRRIFWYENGGNPSRYDDPSDVLVSPAPNDESGTKTYCTGPNPFSTWGPITVPATGVTRACTSLELTNPSANATITGSGIAVDCADVATKFFFQATHGDVNALGCLASCGSTPAISTFNGGPANYRGSGSQIGAFSAGTITEFTSGSNPSAYTVASGNPKRLTFANGGAGYGGNFPQRYQIPDYWAGVSGGNVTVNAASPLVVRTAGNIAVTGSRTVSSVGVGNVSELQWVIAEGNIYIDRNVTQLYGVYIAKGNIYTCANGFSAVSLGAPMATDCTNPLKVNGSLIAGGSVKLQRTHGSLGNGAPAEVIEYNPFVWMQGINPANPLPTSTSGKLDFITTLPPIL